MPSFACKVGYVVDAALDDCAGRGVDLLPAFVLQENLSPNVPATAIGPTSDLATGYSGCSVQCDKQIGKIPTLAVALFQHALVGTNHPSRLQDRRTQAASSEKADRLHHSSGGGHSFSHRCQAISEDASKACKEGKRHRNRTSAELPKSC